MRRGGLVAISDGWDWAAFFRASQILPLPTDQKRHTVSLNDVMFHLFYVILLEKCGSVGAAVHL